MTLNLNCMDLNPSFLNTNSSIESIDCDSGRKSNLHSYFSFKDVTNLFITYPLTFLAKNIPPNIDWNSITVGASSDFKFFYDENSELKKDVDEQSEKLSKNFEQLQEIQTLSNNWDGEGANSFSSKIIERISKVVSELSIQPQIFPTGRDSIQLEYEKQNGDYLEFEFFENGNLKLFCLLDNNNNETTRYINDDEIDHEVNIFYGRQ